MPTDPAFLSLCLKHAPANTEWAISAQTSDPDKYLALQMQAFVQGGHVRCGMEDYVYLRYGELATSNAQCVEQWTETSEIWGRHVASPNEARKLLGMM
jgi:3-keto-5-aminohexanoate cleavage enzyme